MSRLIDADKLEPDTEWNDYDDDFVSYSQSQIRNAEEVQAIRLDKVKRACEEIKNLETQIQSYNNDNPMISQADVLAILNNLLESEE